MPAGEGASLHDSEAGTAAYVLLNRLPFPLDDGWRVRTFQLICALARRQPVIVLAFGKEDDAARDFRAVAGPEVYLRLVPPPARYTPWRLLRGLVGRDPIYVVNERSRPFDRALGEELARTPATFIVCGLVAMYGHAPSDESGVPVIVDTHNIDSLLMRRYAEGLPGPARRWYAHVTAAKLRRYEDHVLRHAGAVVVCSELEREQLEARVPGARVWVIPNGASISQFAANGRPPVPNRLLFFGRLDYHPNRDALGFFLREIFPLIREKRSDVEVHVAGVGADVMLLEELRAATAVIFHGRVENLPELVRSAAVVVVPLRLGGGTRLKILEALAAARPVVTTVVGAEGLAVESGRHLVLADEPRIFAEAVLRLLDDPEAARRLGETGQALVAEHYDWSAVGALLRQRCSDLLLHKEP